MKLGVLGTGMVGETIGSKLVERGHDVMMGSRSADNPKASAWVQKAGARASQGTFADAARFGEMVFNCTSSWAACRSTGRFAAATTNALWASRIPEAGRPATIRLPCRP